ncbi:conserved protein, unknown function, partial [Hepatocystis sp. ex Piliocolobus tephrosceles]
DNKNNDNKNNDNKNNDNKNNDNKNNDNKNNPAFCNLNYEKIDDLDISKSNRLYLFNKFFTSLFYEESIKTHNFIMFNIYNIEQKKHTHKVSFLSEQSYYDIYHLAYNNLLYYAFDCYNFFKYIKDFFKKQYRIYENSTICLYINNNYETRIINRIFFEQNNYYKSMDNDNGITTNQKNNRCYKLNTNRILKTCTKYFLDNFLAQIDKKINIKNVIPIMKKNNYEFDKNNLYFFISNFNLMDKIFSDSHGFDCNKKLYEKTHPNIKTFAIFFKYIHEASKFYDFFVQNNNTDVTDPMSSTTNKINNNYTCNNNYRLIIVALQRGKFVKYKKILFSKFMKNINDEIKRHNDKYDSIVFDNDIVVLFNLSYVIPFYYVEYERCED